MPIEERVLRLSQMKKPKPSKPHVRNRAHINAQRLKRVASQVEPRLPVAADRMCKKRRLEKAEKLENLRDELKRSKGKGKVSRAKGAAKRKKGKK